MLCPVARILAVGYFLFSSATFASTLASITRQSLKKPACTSHPLQPQDTISILKSSIQFCALADPLKDTTIRFLDLKQPTQQDARVISLLMCTTSTRSNCTPDLHVHPSRHFLGQYASPARQTQSAESFTLYASAFFLMMKLMEGVASSRRRRTKAVGLFITIQQYESRMN